MNEEEAKGKIVHVDKPWGSFTQYAHNTPCTVKTLTVKPWQSISLQSHEKRDEMWVILEDGLKAEIGDKTLNPKKGDVLFVPRKTKHRLSAENEARVLEIAFGEFDEEDITRYEDKYGRA